jgi:Transposase
LGRVIIGMDPHKRSATIEIIYDRERILAQGRFATDRDGYQAMLKLGRQHKDRIWAVEGCAGIGRHIAQRLVADGETVLDVPAKLSARARLFDTAQGRKTDPADAHCVAVAALRANGLRPVSVEDTTGALKLLVDRRDGLGRARTEALSRLHHLLLELIPGGAKQFLSAPQDRALLNTIRPRDIVGRTRRQLAAELIIEVAVIDKKIKTANAHRKYENRPSVGSFGSRFRSDDSGRPVWATAGAGTATTTEPEGVMPLNRTPAEHALTTAWPHALPRLAFDAANVLPSRWPGRRPIPVTWSSRSWCIAPLRRHAA